MYVTYGRVLITKLFRMEEVIVISYLFDIVGQHREIHTEVRAFGFDWWFEKDGAKAQPASSKELDPEWGYTLQRKIREDFIWNRYVFEKFWINDFFEIKIKRWLHE